MSGWQNSPYKLEVKSGEKLAFCACGKSQKAPLCDGTHAREKTEKGPEVISFTEDKTIYACGCCQSNRMPFCDGHHKKIGNI